MPVKKKAARTKTNGNGAATTEVLKIPELKVETFQLRIIGDSPLIVHAWSEKAKKQMLDKQMQVASVGRLAKDPMQDYLDSMYRFPEPKDPKTGESVPVTQEYLTKGGATGFPSIGLKAAAVTAAVEADMYKTEARRAFHINGDLVRIDGTPEIREDMVRVGMGTADIRYRAQYPKWSMVITIKHNPKSMSASQIVNLFNLAGFSVGVGEWRPEKDGNHGMFHVDADVRTAKQAF